MRDAFGGTFMFKLMIIFIVFYVSFMTIAVSYAKTFKMKNGVINILEQYQNVEGTQLMSKVDSYLSNQAYNYGENDSVSNNCKMNSGSTFTDNGACIVKYGLGGNSYYYDVTVYMVISFPLFNQDFVIPVTGETTTIKGSSTSMNTIVGGEQ